MLATSLYPLRVRRLWLFVVIAMSCLGAAPASLHSRVEVILAGVAGDCPELASLIEELLLAEQVTPSFSRVGALGSAQLSSQVSQPYPDRVRVWVTVTSRELAVLLFAGGFEDSYLLRQVPLRDGLDELGRERIAQVLQSSTSALLRGTKGMSLAEVQEAVDAPQSTKNSALLATESATVEQQPESQRPFIPRMGLDYRMAWTGSATRLRHGPALRPGLDELGGSPLRVALDAELDWPQYYSGRGAQLRVWSGQLGLMLGVSAGQDRRFRLVAGAGGGISFARVGPKPFGTSSVTLYDRATYLSPILMTEAGAEWSLGRLVVGGRLLTTISLERIHYDLETVDGRAERLFAPWLVVPGLAVFVGYR